jgi:hypothetical protein
MEQEPTLPEFEPIERFRMGPLDSENRETGVRNPDGRFYCFKDGESFVEKGPDRKPFIRLQTGEEIPFEEWASGRE